MTVLTLEVFGKLVCHCSTTRRSQPIFSALSKDNRVPDPDDDEIVAVFFSFQRHDREAGEAFTCESGIIGVDSGQLNPRRLRSLKAEFVDSELELLNRIVDIILELDPDVLSGWEVQARSWGYLSARGRNYGKDENGLSAPVADALIRAGYGRANIAGARKDDGRIR